VIEIVNEVKELGMLDKAALREKLIEAGLQRVADEIIACAQPAILLTTELATKESLTPGGSRFGGKPDLPTAFPWPEFQDKPLAFLGQINLADLGGFSSSGALPSHGLLSFFYDAEQSTWGFDPADRGSWLVHWSSSQPTVRTPLPEAIRDNCGYVPCQLEFRESLTLPTSPTAFSLSDEEDDCYSDLLYDLVGDSHQLPGHPQEIQGQMQLECQLASHGLYCGDATGYKDPRASDLAPGAADWRLLLQIDSDDDPGWMWGDWGRLYYWIRRQDLAARHFEGTWMILQCT
jgi:uncharacterized protein YwqG